MYAARAVGLRQCLTGAVCIMTEARVHKVSLSTKPSGEPGSETESKGRKRTRPSPDVAEGMLEVECSPNPGRHPDLSGMLDNEMVRNVVSRMALASKSGVIPPPSKVAKSGGS